MSPRNDKINRLQKVQKCVLHHLAPTQGGSFYEDKDICAAKHHFLHEHLKEIAEKRKCFSTILLTEDEAKKHGICTGNDRAKKSSVGLITPYLDHITSSKQMRDIAKPNPNRKREERPMKCQKNHRRV